MKKIVILVILIAFISCGEKKKEKNNGDEQVLTEQLKKVKLKKLVKDLISLPQKFEKQGIQIVKAQSLEAENSYLLSFYLKGNIDKYYTDDYIFSIVGIPYEEDKPYLLEAYQERGSNLFGVPFKDIKILEDNNAVLEKWIYNDINKYRRIQIGIFDKKNKKSILKLNLDSVVLDN